LAAINFNNLKLIYNGSLLSGAVFLRAKNQPHQHASPVLQLDLQAQRKLNIISLYAPPIFGLWITLFKNKNRGVNADFFGKK